MEKEELIQYLKDNLKIEIETRKDWNSYGTETNYVYVSVYLGEDLITSDSACS